MLTNGEPDADCFKPLLQPVASLWIVGEIIAGVAEFRTGKGLAPLASAGRFLFGDHRPRRYDDFRWHDPLPLLMELIHYGSFFLAWGGNLNPVAIENRNDAINY